MENLNTRSISLEHTALRESSRRILALLDGAVCACGKTGCAKCLREDTRAFARRVRQHFEVEEGAWTSDSAVPTYGTTRTWIETLVREHGDLRQRLESVCARLEEEPSRESAAPADVGADARADLRRILAELIDHELSETRLYQRAVFEGWSRAD